MKQHSKALCNDRVVNNVPLAKQVSSRNGKSKKVSVTSPSSSSINEELSEVLQTLQDEFGQMSLWVLVLFFKLYLVVKLCFKFLVTSLILLLIYSANIWAQFLQQPLSDLLGLPTNTTILGDISPFSNSIKCFEDQGLQFYFLVWELDWYTLS